MALSFVVMLGFLQQAIAKIKDPRLASNATRYSIFDTVLAAFSVFFMQCESFLEHQRQIHMRDTQPALGVNWCELTLMRQSDGKVIYQNAFITRPMSKSHRCMGQVG
ncbi:hypothetical protein OGM63_05090 [Plectonema radiosum NIES-515]|uniref:Transposase n=1 Tax=Plectonema radiosum NIES-515 TaxID=2986073 RepID=A0ABT3AUV2_9CYAN|nr:hypothetical protein [Plectonema radiosum]MCV3212909.1 hypothetical protein [Plectonema radiosum NIES-515]